MAIKTFLRIYQTLPRRWRFPIVSLAILLSSLALALLIGSLGRAASVAALPASTYVVMNLNDSGVGSLRQAILDANANPGPDDIVFTIYGTPFPCTAATPCVISPLTPLPVITDPVRITGPDRESLLIDANHAFRVFNIAPVPVIITDLTIQNGATTGRGAGIRAFGSLTLARVRLLGNQAEDEGGGVFAAGPLTVNESYFAHNAAYHGGGLYGESNLTLTNSHFISNTAVRFGGGVFAVGSLTVNESYFAHNAAYNGGGLYGASDLALTNSHFINNTAALYGGGAFGHETVSVSEAHFEENQAEYQGGGLFARGELVVEDTIFLGNTADGFGGGISSYGHVTVRGGSVVNNAARGGGGGGLYTEEDLVLEGTAFLNNTATFYGGGAYGDANVWISGGLFQNNTAEQGGGLYALADVDLVDTSFIGNHALDGRGGGIAMPGLLLVSGPTGDERTLSLARTHFISNTASYAGGAVSAYATLFIDSSLFVGNEAQFGGGIHQASGDGLVVNTLFAYNTADNTGAALALDSDGGMAIKHTTIAGQAGNNAPAITLNIGALLLENSIVTRHTTGIRNFSGDFYQDYNLFYQNGVNINGSFNGGANSLNGNPHFVAPQSGDFHIGPGSAALDAGRDAGVTVDFEGDSRPLGGGFDIGFDEADLIAGLAIAYSPSPTVTTQTPVSFTATVTSGSGIVYTWDFGDGSPVENGNPMLHSYTAPGLYTVMVTATNSSGSVSTSVELEVVQGEITLPEYWLYLPIILK